MSAVVDLDGEVWLPVVGFEGEYAVSNMGRVKSLERWIVQGGWPKRDGSQRQRLHAERVLKLTFAGRGYLVVSLHSAARPEVRDGNRVVHRLVCTAFSGPPPFADAVCRHLNDNRTDNRADNLRWGTSADNAADARANGHFAVGERAGQSKLTEAQVVAIRAAADDGLRAAFIAQKFGISTGHVRHLARRESWVHVA